MPNSNNSWSLACGALIRGALISTVVAALEACTPPATLSEANSSEDVSTTYLGDGVVVTRPPNSLYTVRCKGTLEGCYQEAERVCPHDYEILDKGLVAATGTGVNTGSFSSTSVEGITEMRVACKERSVLAHGKEDPGTKEAPKSEPPSGAAGFSFGSSREEIRGICEAANLIFTEQKPYFVCSGTPSAVGQAAAITRIKFCADEACLFIVELTPSETDGKAWKKEYLQLREALTAKYGPATRNDLMWPAGCREDNEIVECLKDDRARFRNDWRWKDGTAIVLSMNMLKSSELSIRLIYRGPQLSGPKQQTDGL